MGMGFTSVCLMAEPPRLPVACVFSHTFLLSWVTLALPHQDEVTGM